MFLASACRILTNPSAGLGQLLLIFNVPYRNRLLGRDWRAGPDKKLSLGHRRGSLELKSWLRDSRIKMTRYLRTKLYELLNSSGEGVSRLSIYSLERAYLEDIFSEGDAVEW